MGEEAKGILDLFFLLGLWFRVARGRSENTGRAIAVSPFPPPLKV